MPPSTRWHCPSALPLPFSGSSNNGTWSLLNQRLPWRHIGWVNLELYFVLNLQKVFQVKKFLLNVLYSTILLDRFIIVLIVYWNKSNKKWCFRYDYVSDNTIMKRQSIVNSTMKRDRRAMLPAEGRGVMAAPRGPDLMANLKRKDSGAELLKALLYSKRKLRSGSTTWWLSVEEESECEQNGPKLGPKKSKKWHD